MAVYKMMTPEGTGCGNIEAYSGEEAAVEAERRGYAVLDLYEHGDELVVVVS